MVRKISKNYSNTDIAKAGSYPVFYALSIAGHRCKTSILLMINDLQETDFESILTHLGGVSKVVLIKMLRELEADRMIKMLRELEADRMIKKITFGSFGSSDYKVGYSLTLTGEQIIPILNSMND